MIPLAVPNLTGRELVYLEECVRTGYVSSSGPFVSRFEALAASAAQTRYAIATSSGTTGLHAALVAIGVQRDDLVVLPSLTFIASANAISHCGALPWLLDVDPKTWTLDPDELNKALSEETTRRYDGSLIHTLSGRRVAAIMPVYTMGLPADMDKIVAIACNFDLPVVADSAAALGATYRGRPVGNLNANLTVFSFNGNKTVTAGGGGIVAGNDYKLCQLVRHLTTTARVGQDYDHDRVGFNYRMTNLQAAVGCAQIEFLDQFVSRKREIQAIYNAAFSHSSLTKPFPSVEWAESACWYSGFLFDVGEPTDFREKLRFNGIDSRPFWKPVHLQEPYKNVPCNSQAETEKIWNRVITLPCSTNIKDWELDKVVEVVNNCLQ
jgi:perosamine synthetase